MNPYDDAAWYVTALTGDPDTIIDWRCIHDTNKGEPGINIRGKLSDVYDQLQGYNLQGYGVFCAINALDGHGRELVNIDHIRTHVVDLDNPITAQANYSRAAASGTFAVQSSPGKYHVYWRVKPYTSNNYYTMIQRKFAQFYDGDKSIIDATRVMRVPGFYHCKGEPYLVTGHVLTNRIYDHSEIDQMLQAVNVIDHTGMRSPLGEASMSAPSLEWLKAALNLMNPNDMDRSEWLSFSAAIKQAGWNHAEDDELYDIWSNWCAKYSENDDGENRKLWNSIRDTEVGWPSIERRSTVKAYMKFGNPEDLLNSHNNKINTSDNNDTPVTVSQTGEVNTSQFGEILSQYECQEWFKNCFFVEREGRVFNSRGRFMTSTQFNGAYGGKLFIITANGKVTDEPWKAALRSTLWQIPKVDHVRFLPDEEPFAIIEDDKFRLGLNTYFPANIDTRPGDISIFQDHLQRILPVESDQKLLLDYLAHIVQYPGHKIPWAPLLQSAEGIGKTVFTLVMKHTLGESYVYQPKAPELISSGSTFNAWMRGKLMIIVDEIKIDERRELIEILKPMISEDKIEIQAKGVDQDMEDNVANWLFFSNFKDAIPINKNGRRYSVFYSALQTEADILNAGMDKVYFDRLFDWLRTGGGLQAVAHYLLNYPIERGAIPVRSPETSSKEEALRISRSPMEVVIAEAVEDQIPGFRGGFVSTTQVIKRCKAAGIRTPNTRTVQACLEAMEYTHIGRSLRPYMQEDINSRSEIYGQLSTMRIEDYAKAQGYE